MSYTKNRFLKQLKKDIFSQTSQKPPEKVIRQESVESVSLDELLEISAKWSQYFNNQLESGFVDSSTYSAQNECHSNYSPMHVSSPAVFQTSPTHSPQMNSRSVHFNLQNSLGSTVSEPSSPRQGVRLKFRQFNLSGTPETSI